MHRFGLNLIAAVLAFALGTFIAVSLYQQTTKPAPRSEASGEILTGNRNLSANDQKQQTDELMCEDEIVRLVWNDLKAELLERQKIRPGTNCSDFLNAQLIADLNDDGKKEILAGRKNPCAGGGCVNFWILQTREFDKLKILLRDTATFADVQKRRTNGFLDVKTGFRSGNADPAFYKLYRFDGERYVLEICRQEAHSVKDGKRNSRKLKKPPSGLTTVLYRR